MCKSEHAYTLTFGLNPEDIAINPNRGQIMKTCLEYIYKFLISQNISADVQVGIFRITAIDLAVFKHIPYSDKLVEIIYRV